MPSFAGALSPATAPSPLFAVSPVHYPPDPAEQQALLVQALTLAEAAHRSQVDKYGQPYFGHVSRVVAGCVTPFEKTVAALHDVVEDTPITLADLRTAGLPDAVVAVVDTLTRREAETYDDYLRRVEADPRAWRVKLADLTDNMDLRRISELTDETLTRLRRYHRAYVRLAALTAADAAHRS